MKTQKLNLIVMLTLSVLLSSCGGGLSGTYVDENGNEITFKGNTLEENYHGDKTEMQYKVNGDAIEVEILKGYFETQYTIDKDGCIVYSPGPLHPKFCKK